MHEPDIVVKLVDGTERTVGIGGPYTAGEQVAFERQFRTSFIATVDEAWKRIGIASMVALAEAEGLAGPDGFDPEIDPSKFMRVEWMLWIAWRRARLESGTGLPARFELFVDLVDDWGYAQLDEEQVAEAADRLKEMAKAAALGGGLVDESEEPDPTIPETPSVPGP